MSHDEKSWIVSDEEAGNRLDRHVAKKLTRARNQIQQWIESSHITVDGQAAKSSTSLVSGHRIVCVPPPPQDGSGLEPESGDLTIVFEDEDLIVVDKPAGIAVHPGAGRDHGTLAHRVLGKYPEVAGLGGAGRPGIVHRIDLDTTGLLIIARTELAYQNLSKDFAERRIDKTYQAIAFGTPKTMEGTIDLPIGRHRGDRKKMSITSQGRPAKSSYRCSDVCNGVCRLEVDILTGRTHQIRVHLKAIGHPLVGDPMYGEARWRGLPRERQKTLRTFARPALHAWRLGLKHPRSGSRLELEAPVPIDMKELWELVTEKPWDI